MSDSNLTPLNPVSKRREAWAYRLDCLYLADQLTRLRPGTDRAAVLTGLLAGDPAPLMLALSLSDSAGSGQGRAA